MFTHHKNIPLEGILKQIEEKAYHVKHAAKDIREHELMRRRELLHGNSDLKVVFNAFWFLLTPYSEHNCLTKEGYHKINHSLRVALHGENSFDDIMHKIEADWKVDSTLYHPWSEEHFFDFLFETIEIWAEGLDPYYYAALAWTILEAISDTESHPPKFRPLREVPCIPKKETDASMLKNYMKHKSLRDILGAENHRSNQDIDIQKRQYSRKKGADIRNDDLLMLNAVARSGLSLHDSHSVTSHTTHDSDSVTLSVSPQKVKNYTDIKSHSLKSLSERQDSINNPPGNLMHSQPHSFLTNEHVDDKPMDFDDESQAGSMKDQNEEFLEIPDFHSEMSEVAPQEFSPNQREKKSYIPARKSNAAFIEYIKVKRQSKIEISDNDSVRSNTYSVANMSIDSSRLSKLDSQAKPVKHDYQEIIKIPMPNNLTVKGSGVSMVSKASSIENEEDNQSQGNISVFSKKSDKYLHFNDDEILGDVPLNDFPLITPDNDAPASPLRANKALESINSHHSPFLLKLENGKSKESTSSQPNPGNPSQKSILKNNIRKPKPDFLAIQSNPTTLNPKKYNPSPDYIPPPSSSKNLNSNSLTFLEGDIFKIDVRDFMVEEHMKAKANKLSKERKNLLQGDDISFISSDANSTINTSDAILTFFGDNRVEPSYPSSFHDPLNSENVEKIRRINEIQAKSDLLHSLANLRQQELKQEKENNILTNSDVPYPSITIEDSKSLLHVGESLDQTNASSVDDLVLQGDGQHILDEYINLTNICMLNQVEPEFSNSFPLIKPLTPNIVRPKMHSEESLDHCPLTINQRIAQGSFFSTTPIQISAKPLYISSGTQKNIQRNKHLKGRSKNPTKLDPIPNESIALNGNSLITIPTISANVASDASVPSSIMTDDLSFGPDSPLSMSALNSPKTAKRKGNNIFENKLEDIDDINNSKSSFPNFMIKSKGMYSKNSSSSQSNSKADLNLSKKSKDLLGRTLPLHPRVSSPRQKLIPRSKSPVTSDVHNNFLQISGSESLLDLSVPFGSLERSSKSLSLSQIPQAFHSNKTPWLPRGTLNPLDNNRSDRLEGWKEKLILLRHQPFDTSKIPMTLKNQKAAREAFEYFISQIPKDD